jgi:hypothetical protein
MQVSLILEDIIEDVIEKALFRKYFKYAPEMMSDAV